MNIQLTRLSHFCLISSLLLSSVFSVAQAATITVTTTSDAIANDGLCTLKEALAAATNNLVYFDCPAGDDNNDTIIFDESVTGTITTTGLSVTSDVTITGPGASNLTVNGNSNNRVFWISGGGNPVVTITGLTVSGGYVTTIGGAGILHTGNGTVTLENIDVVNNQAVATSGGGIYNYSGNMIIRNSNISANTAAGGGGILNNGTLSIESVSINNNSASASGGGVYNITNGVITLSDSLIASNMTGGEGGGLYNNRGTVTIITSLITNNTAGNTGGGITNSGSLTISESDIAVNTSQFTGSGIHNSFNATMWMNANTVRGNEVTSGIVLPAIYQGGVATIINSTITGNTGSGIENGATEGTSTSMSNVTITQNTVYGYRHARSAQLKNTIISNNQIADCSRTGIDSYTDAGYNLDSDGTCALTAVGSQSSVDPLLVATLQYNGGNTPNHALQTGSPAIDAGNTAGCLWDHDNDSNTAEVVLMQDQRGVTRPLDGDANGTLLCDIGAFEVSLPREIVVTDSVDPSDDLLMVFADTTEGNSSAVASVTLTNLGSEALTVSGLTISGTDTDDFSYDVNAGDNPCGDLDIVITGSSSCTIGVIFKPTGAGAKAANLIIMSNDADEDTVNIVLTGIGLTASGTGTDAAGGGGGGCTIRAGQSDFDPLLPLIVLLMMYYLTRNNKRAR